MIYEEVKSNAGWQRERKRIEPLLASFAASRGATYAHRSHEEIDAEGSRALVWIRITRWIVQYAHRDLSKIKRELLDAIKGSEGKSVFELLRFFTQHQDDHVIAAICVLLHSGDLIADLNKRFNMATMVRLP